MLSLCVSASVVDVALASAKALIEKLKQGLCQEITFLRGRKPVLWLMIDAVLAGQDNA